MVFKVPAESWIEAMNETLASEGLIPERRPMEAYRRWCLESRQSISFGGEATQVIGDWFARNTTYGHHVRQPFARTAFYWDMCFLEVGLPLVFGSPQINPFALFRNVPVNVVQRLARSSSSDEYIGHFENAYGIFVMEENIRRINEDGLSPAVQFVIAASRHLASATAALLGSPPSPKALEDSRLAVEIAIKAVLILKFGYTDLILQKQFSHRLGLLRKELLKVKPDLGFTEADLAIYPEISARYGDIAEDRDRLWKGYALAVSIVATGFEIIQDEMLG